MSRVVIVVLAAGEGRRMQGRVKQLVRIDGETLLHRSVKVALDSLVGDVFVVLGFMFDELSESLLSLHEGSQSEGQLVSREFKIVRNELWAEGIASSIRASIPVVEDYDAVIFMTVDQPFVNESWLRKLKDSFVETECEVVASLYGNPKSPGIPSLFSKNKFEALKSLRGDRGAKKVIMESKPLLLEWDQLAVDIDTVEDLMDCAGIHRGSGQLPELDFAVRGGTGHE